MCMVFIICTLFYVLISFLHLHTFFAIRMFFWIRILFHIGALFYFCIPLSFVYFFPFRMPIHTFQFLVNHRNTSSYSICFPKFHLHQIIFNSIQTLFSFFQRTSMDSKVFSHTVLSSLWTGKFPQLLSSGGIGNFSLKISSN